MSVTASPGEALNHRRNLTVRRTLLDPATPSIPAAQSAFRTSDLGIAVPNLMPGISGVLVNSEDSQSSFRAKSGRGLNYVWCPQNLRRQNLRDTNGQPRTALRRPHRVVTEAAPLKEGSVRAALGLRLVIAHNTNETASPAGRDSKSYQTQTQ
jgi:hypothetical protein